MLFDITNIGGRPRKGRCVMMKRKPIGKANLLKLNIEREKENIKRLEENLESLQAALKVQEAKDERENERKRANNRARYKANKIIKQYPEYGFRIERDYPDGIHSLTLWVFMSDEMERKATEMQHHLMDSHWADDWIDVSERLDEMVTFCKEHHQA